jgi:outer membrane autotransporter protein
MMRAPGFNMSDGLEAAPGAVQTLAGVRGGWLFSPAEGLNIGPTMSLNYSSLALDGYNEQGVGDFALGIDGRTLTSITLEPALEFNYAPVNRNGRAPFAAYGRLGLVTELGDGADVVTARFLAVPEAAFDIERALDRNWVSTAFGLSYQLGEGMAANVEAAADMGREEFDNTSVRAGFSWQF